VRPHPFALGPALAFPWAMRFKSLFFASLVSGLAACGAGGGSSDGPDGGVGGPPPFTNGVSTLAGWPTPGRDDGPRDVAHFNNPTNVAVGPDGKVYVADFDNGLIRAVATDGTTETVIAKQGFVRPFGLAFAKDGTLYVSTDNDDAGGHNLNSGTVWKVDVHAKTATVVIHGIGRPRGIAALSDGRLALSDDLHHVIRILDPKTAGLTTLAGAWDVKGFADGAGAAARFSTPYGIVQRGDGKLVVADYDNARIRLIGLDGSVATLAGSGSSSFADGSMTQASFNHPQGVAIAGNGDVYVTDTGNFKVRRLRGDSVETVAGDGNGGWKDDDDRMAGEFFGLEGIAVTADGSMIYIADGNRGDPLPYNRIRQVKL
jgi:DNA-binding beta-propeller fold protein YncE